MTSFKYAAKGPGGKTVEGEIEASDRTEVLNELRRKNLVVMSIDEVKGRKKGRRGKTVSSRGVKPNATRVQLVLFTRQLSTMIGAGISLLEGLDVLGDQAETPPFKACCELLSAEVRGGSDLSAAMEKCPKAFSELYVSMVKAAEVSGQMDIILVRLADYLESAEELRREIKSAMTYPVVSMVLVSAITAFLMIGIVPGFRQVFDSLDSELPTLTKVVLETSEWMRANWIIGMGIISAVMFGGWSILKTEKGQFAYDKLSLKVPVFGPLFSKVALARFSRTFSTLIRSGVPIMGTLDIVAATSGNRVISKAVLASREAVRSGNMLSEPLAQSPVFPPMVVRMIAIGEKSGALETLLEKIADFYDAEVKATVKSLTSLIEPILISVMGVMVGGVVLSVFLPILDVVGNLSGSK
ncbi:MAG: type IV pilus assembly protein PilC [Candidatus Paceibacteria bacterium]